MSKNGFSRVFIGSIARAPRTGAGAQLSIVKRQVATGRLEERLATVNRRIRDAERRAGRAPDSVKLLAVSKTQPPEALVRVYQAGQRHFGESYVQEALAKITCLAHYDITWHFIGPIQSNKTRAIAQRFAWVHSLDRFKIAERLCDARPAHLPPLNICIQINASGEATKSGIPLAELPALAAALAQLPRLRLRGLMTIPPPASDFSAQRRALHGLREAFDALSAYAVDTLSMGMSNDLEAAIMEGATLVRVGTAIFGSRSRRDDALR